MSAARPVGGPGGAPRFVPRVPLSAGGATPAPGPRQSLRGRGSRRPGSHLLLSPHLPGWTRFPSATSPRPAAVPGGAARPPGPRGGGRSGGRCLPRLGEPRCAKPPSAGLPRCPAGPLPLAAAGRGQRSRLLPGAGGSTGVWRQPAVGPGSPVSPAWGDPGSWGRAGMQ